MGELNFLKVMLILICSNHLVFCTNHLQEAVLAASSHPHGSALVSHIFNDLNKTDNLNNLKKLINYTAELLPTELFS